MKEFLLVIKSDIDNQSFGFLLSESKLRADNSFTPEDKEIILALNLSMFFISSFRSSNKEFAIKCIK